MINHENIAALHQLDHPLLEKTLLEKIQCANDRDIPFYLCVQGTLPRKAALLSRVCRAVTFLADQAINAASASQGESIFPSTGMQTLWSFACSPASPWTQSPTGWMGACVAFPALCRDFASVWNSRAGTCGKRRWYINHP